MKIIKITFLLFSFSLVLISTKKDIKASVSETKDKAVEFKIGDIVTFNPLNNYNFVFNNLKENFTIFLYIIKPAFDYKIELQEPDGNIIDLDYFFRSSTNVFFATLNQVGNHYIKIEAKRNFYNIDEKFRTIAPGEVVETIDLSKEIYYSNLTIESETLYEPIIYRIKNLNEDKYVYFEYENRDTKENPFKICVNEEDQCESNQKFYYFEKGKEYTIYIQFVKSDFFDDEYYYIPHAIVPVLNNTIETITTGIFKNTSPKIFNIDTENKIKYIIFGLYQKILLAKLDEAISFGNLNIIKTLDYSEYNQGLENIEELGNSKYYVLIAIPMIFETEGIETVIAVADNIIGEIEGDYITIPPDKSSLIFLPPDYYERRKRNPLDFYNVLVVYSSASQNMRYVCSSNLDKEYNILFHNFAVIPTFIDKSQKEQKINFKVYYPRFTFFGIANAELFKTFYSLLKPLSNSPLNVDIETFLPLNTRISSDFSQFYEFFNFYLDKFEDNINLYINKLYGDTNFYECSNELNKNDLSILQYPINKCKNKKSLFNRFFTFKGSKLLSGYLTPNSYFEIYLEFNDDSNKIKISQPFQGTINSASKYIKKGIEYTVDFPIEHMVKIEILDNIEVTISNDKNTIKLNSQKPVAFIEGNNYKVKANKDTMIYFYGKLYKYIKQKELFVDQKGKYAIINSDKDIRYFIDSGFKDFNPLNIYIFEDLYEYINIYIENIYEKMKNKLAENEKIFLYYTYDEESYNYEEPQINVTYNEILNNPNNDYTFTVIPKNSEQKSFIINNRQKYKIYYHVNFCGDPHNIVMSYKGRYQKDDYYSKELTFSEEYTYYLEEIEILGTKINFKSDKEFIFSYSFYDEADETIIDNTPWEKEREEELSTNLNITQVTENDNILSISFKPSYKNSNTKYILVIAPENDKNTVESLSNPCYIAKLVNDREDGVRIENWIDPGLTDEITAEIDMNNFIIKNNDYIIGIISQELRFYKKLNFYSAVKFRPKNENKTLIIIIIFSIVGAIVLIATIVLIVFLLRKRNGKDNLTEAENNNDNKLISDI